MANRRVLAIAVAVVTIVSSPFLAPVVAASASTSLSGELLGVGAMPVGWSVVTHESRLEITTGSSGLSGCFDKALDAVAAAPYISAAAVGFAYGGTSPDLAELLIHEKAAGTVFARVESICTTGQMSFPNFGNSSAAYSASGGGEVAYMLVMRKGPVLLVLAEEWVLISGVVPSVSQFEHFARLAAPKVH